MKHSCASLHGVSRKRSHGGSFSGLDFADQLRQQANRILQRPAGFAIDGAIIEAIGRQAALQLLPEIIAPKGEGGPCTR
jgi:hypothetical protein